MEQFNSYLMNLDLDALRTYFAEHGRLCRYEKEERFAQQGIVYRYNPVYECMQRSFI